MELHLIRHGQTDWNEERRVQGQSESRLTKLGEEQASALGKKLNLIDFDKVFCSSSLRARQTAENLFTGTELQIEYLDTLREIFLGPWEGILYDEIEQREPDSFRHFWEEPHLFDVSGAENFFDLQTRALNTIFHIAKTHPNQCIVIVSHGALIKTILCYAEGRSMSELWSPPHMHNCAHSIIKINKDDIENIIQYADIPFSELER